MQQQTSQIDAPIHDRKVWIINTLEVPQGEDPSEYTYREEFRGRILEVPPKVYNEELDGYRVQKKLLMNYLEARRFLGVAVALAEPNPDGSYYNAHTGRVDPTKFGKPLKMLELTVEEKKIHDPDGLTAKEQKELEKQLASKNHIGEHSGEVEAIGKGKPQAQNKRRGRPSTRDAAAELAAELDT